MSDVAAWAQTVRDAIHRKGAPFGPGSLEAYLAWRDDALAALLLLERAATNGEGIDRDLFGTVCYERDAAESRVRQLEEALRKIADGSMPHGMPLFPVQARDIAAAALLVSVAAEKQEQAP